MAAAVVTCCQQPQQWVQQHAWCHCHVLHCPAGLIDDSIYDSNCTFVDPTVKFSGMSGISEPLLQHCVRPFLQCGSQHNAWALGSVTCALCRAVQVARGAVQ